MSQACYHVFYTRRLDDNDETGDMTVRAPHRLSASTIEHIRETIRSKFAEAQPRTQILIDRVTPIQPELKEELCYTAGVIATVVLGVAVVLTIYFRSKLEQLLAL